MALQVGLGPRAAVWRILIQTTKRSGDSTQHCRSPTPTLNRCDLTQSSTRTQSSEQEYSYLTASKRQPPTVLRQFIERQFIERQFIERQFIEPTAHRTDSCRKIAVSSVAILDYLLLCLTVNCKIFNLPTSLFSSRI